jgi:hypothetical protein
VIPAIPHFGDRNYAGICHVDLVDVADVESVPDELNGHVASAIVLKTGKSWTRIYLEDDGGSLVDRWVVDGGAQRSEALLKGAIAKDRLELMPHLWRFKGRRYLALPRTRNGDLLLMGRVETPAMVLVRSRQTGEGANMESDRNEYMLEISITRRWPVPFYGGSPPTPGVPASCPTLADQLAGATWATIEALLSSGQLGDAQTSICPVPTPFCDQVDAAIVLPVPGGGGIVVSGAGAATANGTYTEDGTMGGRPNYELGNGWVCQWTGSNWMIHDGSQYYVGVEDVATPDLVTTWNALTAPAPAPTVEAGGGGTPGDASGLTDCFSPEQEEVVLADLMASMDGAAIYAAMNPTQQGEIPPGQVQLVDEDLNPIGSPVDVSPEETVQVEAPDGVVHSKNSLGTTLVSTAVRSNGSADAAIPDTTITRTDGTTAAHPAGVAFDVRDLRSGIVYNNGLILASGQTTVHRTGDEGTMRSLGRFTYTRPLYPLSYAELATFTTLVANNVHGNTLRFTDRAGAAAATSGNRVVRDHWTGWEYYRAGTLPPLCTWNDAIDAAEASTAEGDTDWHLPTDRLLDTITDDSLTSSLNYGPFLITTPLWTATTRPDDSTVARVFRPDIGSLFGNLAKSAASTCSYILCRRFA